MKTNINQIRKMMLNGHIPKKNGMPYSEATKTTYNTILNNLIPLLTEKDISSIRAKIRANGGESTTENQYMMVLAWAIRKSNELLGTNYKIESGGYSTEEFDMFVPEHERVVKMISSFVPENKQQEKAFRYIRVAAITGARYSDMKSWSADQNIANGKLVYIPRKKGSRQIEIPLNQILKDSFSEDRLLPVIPYSTLIKEVKNIFRICGFTNEIIRTRKVGNKLVSRKMFEYEAMGLHRLRASAITGFLQSGMSESEAKSFSGHSFDSKSFKRYVRFSQSHLSDKFGRFADRF
jgi:hypothetical protein